MFTNGFVLPSADLIGLSCQSSLQQTGIRWSLAAYYSVESNLFGTSVLASGCQNVYVRTLFSERDRNPPFLILRSRCSAPSQLEPTMAFQTRRFISSLSPRQYRQRTYRTMALVALLIILLSYIPVQMVITRLQFPNPQAIFTLGGRPAREAFTAEFAQSYPNLPIWISSGMNSAKAQPFFTAAGIDLNRVNFDFQATDTVTNFTTLVDEFNRRHIRHVYLITSDFHMVRARAIAAIVFGSRRIITTPVVVPSRTTPESKIHVLRDIVRSVVWLLTQQTGAHLRFQLSATTFK
jgi:uncharacterized SAM-binding protein YcdF (DUF218 family)